jgi:hypothetical protein
MDRINGGEMDGLTVALNCYMNQNFEIMLDYVNDFRCATPVVAAPGVPISNGANAGVNTTATGSIQGIGIRAQLQF